MEVDQDSEAPSCSFYVVRVPEAVFSTDPDVSLKPEFEAVFRSYGNDVNFVYLKSFGRVSVTYPTLEQARLAQSNLHNHEFQGTSLKLQQQKPITIGSRTLQLPPTTKQFILSPPASPPVGWEPSQEQSPCVDFSLVTALASLQLPGEELELHQSTLNTPSIVVVTPEDQMQELTPTVLHSSADSSSTASTSERSPAVKIAALPPSIVHTARPPV